jgi:hypothetical protein
VLYLSVSQAGTILSKFNNTESDMDNLESQSLKEAAWRSRLLRHAQSGKSIAAFCRDESVSTASFISGGPSWPQPMDTGPMPCSRQRLSTSPPSRM